MIAKPGLLSHHPPRMNNKDGLLLAFGGYGKVGKDTLANIVEDMLPPGQTKVYKFAEALRNECLKEMSNAGVSLDPWTENPEEKEKVRPWLVRLGAERRKEHKDYWVRKVFEDIDKESKFTGVRIIADLRYENEAKWILSRGGIIVVITRDGYGPLNDEEATHTTLLYDHKHPLSFHKNFRRFWWAHEIEGHSTLPKVERERQEGMNLLETVPELNAFDPYQQCDQLVTA